MSVLEVSGLTKRFGGIVAVDAVDFALETGEMLAIIGPNGAGKSTCFNLITGQLSPDAGRVCFQGRDLAGLGPRAIWRLGVGRTFQITATFPTMTALENVHIAVLSHHRLATRLFRAMRGFHADKALSLLENVGMVDQADRLSGVLAYGDLKRLELAIALANDPSVLLMDEPTAGMAPGERTALMAQVARLVRERGVSVLFTEHDMDVVFGHADRILVLNRGAVIALGPPDAVRNDPEVRAIYLGEPGRDAEAAAP